MNWYLEHFLWNWRKLVTQNPIIDDKFRYWLGAIKQQAIIWDIVHPDLYHHIHDNDGLVQDCSNSIANALELLQSHTKPSICRPWATMS